MKAEYAGAYPKKKKKSVAGQFDVLILKKKVYCLS
jgi:hypothetical protein